VIWITLRFVDRSRPPLRSVHVSSNPVTPDSVRLALPAEASSIARIQRHAWQQRLAPEAAAVLGEVDLDALVDAWHRAITRPPGARFRVLVALSSDRGVVGFAATVPCADADAAVADGEIEEFVVDPAAQRRGHGSRLLHACVDTLAADGFARALWWLGATDDVLRTFATEAGWAADGAWREIGVDDDEHPQVRLKQVRLHTDIAAA
jgi:GNAT superfamily N-acetyltransferase